MKDFKVYQASGYLKKLVTDASDVRKEYEEISGSLVQFDTPISAPLESLIVDINPVQSGTGDPSPDNVRPITGWTEVNIYHSGEDTSNPTVYTVSWQDEAGTVYGGTVDVVNGVLTVDMASVDISTLNFSASNPNVHIFRTDSLRTILKPSSDGTILANALCSAFWQKEWTPITGNDNGAFGIAADDSAAAGRVIFIDHRYSTNADFIAGNQGVQLVYELRTPVEYQITPEEINTLIGVNNIWADTGDVSVKYRTH